MPDDLDRLLAVVDTNGDEPPPHTDEDAPPDPGAQRPAHLIPEEWWSRRPALAAMLDWARHRLVPPEIVLVHALADVAMRVPTDVVIPPLIGSHAPLNFGAVVVATTGMGKTTGGRRLLGSAISVDLAGESWPLGTGEGLVHLLLDEVDGELMPHRRPLLILADEGRVLADLLERRGAVIVATLLSAISGAELGQANADAKRRRRVPADAYRLAVLLNVQPKYLDGVLIDIDGGLPQRFLFVTASLDLVHDIDSPAPPAIAWPDVESIPWAARDGTRRAVAFPDDLRRQVRLDHIERTEARASHRNLLRLRLAALLAVLDGRGYVTDDDWTLTATLVDCSDATIEAQEQWRRQLRAEAERIERDRAAATAVSVDRAVEHDAVSRLGDDIHLMVLREPGITVSNVRRSFGPRRRDLLDPALARLVRERRVHEVAEPGQGTDRRTLRPGPSSSEAVT